MRLLDLYCGAGGAAEGYWMAGFDPDIDWITDRDRVAEALQPVYTEHIGMQLIELLRRNHGEVSKPAR